MRCQSGKRGVRITPEILPVFNMAVAETPGRVYAKALRSPQQNISRRQNQVATSEKIRIKLKSYDSALIDAAAEKFVDAAKRNGEIGRAHV